MLCLPWDSFLVSNDRPKIEQLFKSRQDGAVEKPRLWRKILQVQRVNNGSLDGRSGAIGDPHHPEGAPVGELTGIRHILPQSTPTPAPYYRVCPSAGVGALQIIKPLYPILDLAKFQRAPRPRGPFRRAITRQIPTPIVCSLGIRAFALIAHD